MVLCAFSHGLRATEVVGGWLVNKRKEKRWYPGITPESFHDGHIIVPRLKGSRLTSQPLLEHADPLLNEKESLLEFARKSEPKSRLFPISRQRFWQIMQEHCATANIAPHKRHPHSLKHSIAKQMIRLAGIENTRQYLGHESISSTGVYLEVTDEDASAAAADALRR